MMKNTGFAIEPYEKRDRAQLRLLELPEKYIKQYTNSPPFHYVLSMLGVSTNYLYLMRQKDSPRVVGTILLRKRLDLLQAGYCWKMHAVYVSPELRGRGLGAELVDYAVQELRHRQVLRVSLKVDDDNTPAIRLYKKCGFVEKLRRNRQIIMVKQVAA